MPLASSHVGPINPAEWQEAARAVLPNDVFDFVAGGSGRETTLQANEQAWDAVRLRPRVLRGVGDVSSTTSLLGTEIGAPIAIAPTAYQSGVHPEAEVAMAAGALDSQTLLTVSSRASKPFGDIAAVGAPWWCQIYVLRNRDITARLVEQAVLAGAKALVFTVDAPVLGERPRDIRNGFVSPVSVSSNRWESRAGVRRSDQQQDPSVSLADIAWLKSLSGLPVVVKGVLRGDDAQACVDAGADAVWVSNHGGRQLDGSITTVDALIEVVDSVTSDCEIYVDGGIRSGVDALRAVCLGATAAFVGRPVVWGLAVDGAAGVKAVLTQMNEEFRRSMTILGAKNIAECQRHFVQ